MTVFIGADHRGFELKDQIIEYLQSKNIRAEDMGNYEYDPNDDNPLFAQKVAEAVLQNPQDHLGIVVCGSGVGVSIAANRYEGIYCGLGLSKEQVKHARENDHINILALSSDFVDFEDAKKMVDAYLSTTVNKHAKYLRRLKMIDKKYDREATSHKSL